MKNGHPYRAADESFECERLPGTPISWMVRDANSGAWLGYIRGATAMAAKEAGRKLYRVEQVSVEMCK